MTTRPHHESDRRAAHWILIGIGLLSLAVILWRISDVLIVGFGGIVLAALIRSLAVPISRRTHLRDRWSVLLVVALMMALMGVLAWLFGHQAAEQATAFKTQLPAAANKLVKAIESTDTGRTVIDALNQSAGGSGLLSNVGLAATAVAAAALDLLLIVFLGIYFALDVRLYRDGTLRLLPPGQRPRVGRVLDDAGAALQKWLLGQAVAMITVGILVGVGLAIVGVPLPFALGLVAAVLEFVPVVGPILFSIPGLLLAFAHGPQTALYALLVYLIVQQFEGNVLIPVIQRWAVELPPVVGLLAILAGWLLLGVAGVVFATPLAVVTMCFVKHLYVEETLENAAPVRPARI